MITRIQNNTQTSFKRGFQASEIAELQKAFPHNAVEIGHKIGTGEIRAQDGALKQLEQLKTPKGMTLPWVEAAKKALVKMDKFHNKKIEIHQRPVREIELSKARSLDVTSIVDTAANIGAGIITKADSLKEISNYKHKHGFSFYLGQIQNLVENTNTYS